MEERWNPNRAERRRIEARVRKLLKRRTLEQALVGGSAEREYHEDDPRHDGLSGTERFCQHLERRGYPIVDTADGGKQTRCPAHEPLSRGAIKSPSLKIDQRGDKALVCCQSQGCTGEEICAAVGFPIGWLFDKPKGRGSKVVALRPTLTLAEFSANKNLPEPFLRERGVIPNPNQKAGLIFQYRRDNYIAEKHRDFLKAPETEDDDEDGAAKPRKHDWPYGVKMFAFNLPAIERAREAGIIYVTEGESDALTLDFNDMPAIGVPGATHWKTVPLAEIARCACGELREDHDAKGQCVKTNCKEYACPIKEIALSLDNDPAGRNCLLHVKQMLKQYDWSGKVSEVILKGYKDVSDVWSMLCCQGPVEEQNEKQLNAAKREFRSYLRQHTQRVKLDELIDAPDVAQDDGHALREDHHYVVKEQGIAIKIYSKKGEYLGDRLLTNFHARIAEEIELDDGGENEQERRLVYRVEIVQGERKQTIAVPSASFDLLAWVAETDANFIMQPGRDVKEHIRSGVRYLSRPIPKRTQYVHTGWQKINSSRAFLHAGGAIGLQGAIDGVDVAFSGAFSRLARLELLLAKDREQAKAAVRASLAMFTNKLAPAHIIAPALGAAYRAPVPKPTDFTVALFGHTQVFKSELATLLQQHFGRTITSRTLPTWLNTSMFVEGLAHAAADTVFVVDDFVPASVARPADLIAQVQRFVRAKGNNDGRGRGMRDGVSLRSSKLPRALPLMTGEDRLTLQSDLARMVCIEVRGSSPADSEIDKQVLTQCQKLAREGMYSTAIGEYVRWIARHYDAVVKAAGKWVLKLREYVSSMRTSDNIAELAIGWVAFLAFAIDAKALTLRQAEKLWEQVWDGLHTCALAQQEQQHHAEPTNRFALLIGSAMASGRAYIDEEVTSAYIEHYFVPKERVGSDCIGWRFLDGSVYLNLHAALNAARAMDGSFFITPRTMASELHAKQLLVSSDIEVKGRNTHLVRRSINGKSCNVLHVKPSLLGFGMEEKPEITHKTHVEKRVKIPPLAKMTADFACRERVGKQCRKLGKGGK